jgi:hypothetical protein
MYLVVLKFAKCALYPREITKPLGHVTTNPELDLVVVSKLDLVVFQTALFQ